MDEHLGYEMKGLVLRLGANMSPIVSHLDIILQIFNQMWIIMGENLEVGYIYSTLRIYIYLVHWR
jgi:hypothetical protein